MQPPGLLLLLRTGRRQRPEVDLVELLRICSRPALRAAELVHFLVDALDTAVRIGVVVEERDAIPARILRLDLLEKSSHGRRIVAGVGQALRAHDVGLTLIRAWIL